MIPFEGSYAGIFAMSAISFADSISMETILDVRVNLIKNWYNNKKNSGAYANKLLAYQKDLVNQGHFTTYTHWLLSSGDAAFFESWLKEHQSDFKSFVEFYASGYLTLKTADKYGELYYLRSKADKHIGYFLLGCAGLLLGLALYMKLELG